MKTLCMMVLLASACGGATLAKREPDEYVGCATDEIWPLFDEATDLVDDSQAPLILTPSDGASLPSTPVDVTWQVTPTIVGEPQGDIAATCAQWNTGYTTLHLPPVSGTIYDLQLVSGGEIKHRVLTSLQKWAASADTWTHLAGDSIELHLTRLTVEQNDPEAGPYAPSTSPTISISPR